jgi:SAM-dependent methyltransferase
VRERHEANRRGWNEGAAEYAKLVDETIAFLRGGGSNLHPVERSLLAPLGPLRDWCGLAIHLQCASGRDTLSLWNEGARRVVGIDISDVHIENARRTAEALGAPAAWHRCDLLDAPRDLDGSADLVYTGRGALCWLHDLGAWARVIHRLLRPGGVVSVFDDHAISWLFDPEAETLIGSGIDYFRHVEASRGFSPTYLGDLGRRNEELAEKYERLWTPSAVHGALRDAGLDVLHFGEHADEYYPTLPRLRPELRARIPLTFSMLARRPGAP